MEFKANVPIYLQVIQDIKHKIITGELALGSKLPSSRELALQYSINPNTAARIYSELETAGISFTRRGIGTFVTEDETLVKSLKSELIENLMEEFVEQTRKLGFSHDEIAELLQTYMGRVM